MQRSTLYLANIPSSFSLTVSLVHEPPIVNFVKLYHRKAMLFWRSSTGMAQDPGYYDPQTQEVNANSSTIFLPATFRTSSRFYVYRPS